MDIDRASSLPGVGKPSVTQSNQRRIEKEKKGGREKKRNALLHLCAYMKPGSRGGGGGDIPV